jgi:hypothetical protein
VFEGILTYELQREQVKCDNQLESTRIRLFMIWKSEGYKEFRARINLVEYDEKFDLDYIKSQNYYRSYAGQLRTCTNPIKDTWLLHDGTVLMTRLELDFTQRDGVLSLIISEGIGDEHTRRPEWINLKRYVSFETKDSLMIHANVYC